MYDCEVKWVAPSAAQIKMDPETGKFEGYCAGYMNVDSWGDRLLVGSGAAVAAANPTLPVYFDHGWMRGEAPVGKSLGFEERDYGLYTRGQIFTTFDQGRQVHTGMLEKVLNSLSIGWKADEWKVVDGIREVSKFSLEEYSVVNFPANENAKITAVKSQLASARVGLLPHCKGLQQSVDELLARLPRLDLTGDHIERKTVPTEVDPVAVLLDEADYLTELTGYLKADGREGEVRDALIALKQAVANLEDLLPKAVSDEDDLVAFYRSLTANIREAAQAL